MGTAEQGLAMDRTVSRLRSAYQQSMTHVGGSFWTPGSATDAIRGALRMDLVRIEELDNELRQRVLRGELAYSAWVGIAQATASDMEAQSGYVVSWGHFWNEVVVESANDALTVAKFGGPVIVLLAVAGLVLYLLMLRKAVPV